VPRKVPGATNPRLHALAVQQEARGWALYGDATRFQQQIDDAGTLLREHSADHDPAAPVYLHQYSLDVAPHCARARRLSLDCHPRHVLGVAAERPTASHAGHPDRIGATTSPPSRLRTIPGRSRHTATRPGPEP
jgi:hypothetical protein